MQEATYLEFFLAFCKLVPCLCSCWKCILEGMIMLENVLQECKEFINSLQEITPGFLYLALISSTVLGFGFVSVFAPSNNFSFFILLSAEHWKCVYAKRSENLCKRWEEYLAYLSHHSCSLEMKMRQQEVHQSWCHLHQINYEVRKGEEEMGHRRTIKARDSE